MLNRSMKCWLRHQRRASDFSTYKEVEQRRPRLVIGWETYNALHLLFFHCSSGFFFVVYPFLNKL